MATTSPIDKLISGFAAAPGTHVVAIAGVLDSSGFSTRNDSKDVLDAGAKMYAGVNGKINAKNVDEMDTPEKWVFRLTDSKQKTLETHRTLTQVTSDNMQAAKEMYKNIYFLASTDYKTIKTLNNPKLGDKITKGAYLGNRFQLLFKYTPPNGAAPKNAALVLVEADTALASANEKKVVVDKAAAAAAAGAGAAKTSEQEAADAAVTAATEAKDKALAAFKSISDAADAELNTANDALTKATGEKDAANLVVATAGTAASAEQKAAADAAQASFTSAEEAVRVAAAAAAATKINGTGYIRYGNSDIDIKSFSVKNNRISASDEGTIKVLKLLTSLIGAGEIDYSKDASEEATNDAADESTGNEAVAKAKATATAALGGKLSLKKRRTSFKKGGRNNSASRKRNKKGGAKIRRSQKGGKRMR